MTKIERLGDSENFAPPKIGIYTYKPPESHGGAPKPDHYATPEQYKRAYLDYLRSSHDPDELYDLEAIIVASLNGPYWNRSSVTGQGA